MCKIELVLDMKTKVSIIKKSIRNANKNKCYSCGTKQDLTKHHAIPLSIGGGDIHENIVRLCCKCHRHLHRQAEEKNLNEYEYLILLEKMKLKHKLDMELGYG